MSSSKIDRAFLKAFTKDALKALDAVAATYGITAAYKGGSYDRNGANATLKFELAAPNAAGVVETREAQDFKSLAHVFGLRPEDLGSKFNVRGTTYQITGLKSRRRKYPISAIRVSDGKAFKFPEATVKRDLFGTRR
jgi:hypothetical protein